MIAKEDSKSSIRGCTLGNCSSKIREAERVDEGLGQRKIRELTGGSSRRRSLNGYAVGYLFKDDYRQEVGEQHN